jgi:hypothetical protein
LVEQAVDLIGADERATLIIDDVDLGLIMSPYVSDSTAVGKVRELASTMKPARPTMP